MAQSESAGGETLNTGQVRLERLYLKDASFESPRSPDVFSESWNPEVQLEINSKTNTQTDDRFEVVLTVTLRAKAEGSKTALIIEVQQAGVFLIEGVDDAVRQRVLATVCPNILFPYIRETVDSMAVRGGFPAIQLAPVNFDAVYADAMAKKDRQNPPADVTH